MNEQQKSLEDLLKAHKISQRTFELTKIAKEYIERKYNLKSIMNTKWNNIIEKINSLNINKSVKSKIIDEINKEEMKKMRKNREKQTIRDYESLVIIGRGHLEKSIYVKKKIQEIYMQ